MEAEEVLLAYAQRWPIEPMFQQMKHEFGCKHLWQQKLRTLLRWMHIKMAGYALLQLLTICQNKSALEVGKIAWRPENTVTAGMLKCPLCWIIPPLRVRRCWNRYEQKLELISEKIHDRPISISPKAA